MRLASLLSNFVAVCGLALPALGVEFFVAPGGSDANSGATDRPFATLTRARDALREARKAGLPTSAATVWLRAGTYFLNQPFVLTAADSGAAGAPVVYRGEPGATVRLVGARLLTASAFQPVTNPALLARIPPPARGQVMELDLAALGIRHRGPYPDVFADNGGILELFFNGRRMPLARFPNEGYMTMQRVLDNAGGIRDRNWEHPSAPSRVSAGAEGGTFLYREPFSTEHASWQKVLDRGVWLKGYWRVAWQNEAIRVKAIDTARHTVTFAKPIPGGIGSKYHRPEGSGQEQYWLLNLLEAVDRPGAWCIDFLAHKLYFYPPGPLPGAEMLIGDEEEALVRLNSASHVVLRGLMVEGGLGHGIQVVGGASNLVVGCTVRNQGRYGVVLDGGAGHEVRSCDLYELGAGGVWLGGGDETSTPRVAAGHRVVNNHIHHFARIEKVYAPGINCGYTGGGGGGHHPAVGMYVAHNLIHHTPHAGILFGSWDSVFEYNEILAYCEVSNDMGGWYCYDQFDRDGNQTFRYNFIHSSGEGDGVYFDNDHRDMHIYGNVICLNTTGKRGTAFLYKIGTQPKHPQTIDCRNNVAINCNIGFAFVSAQPSTIANNVVVHCKTPYTWQVVREGRSVPTDSSLGSGKNIAYEADPGFVAADRLDFRLRPEASVFRDLPGFQPIPFAQIGLYVDDDRRRLPNAEESGRSPTPEVRALRNEILDRK